MNAPADTPIFLTIDHVLKFHRDQLERYGGQDGVREQSLLESAIAQAQATYHYGNQDLYEAAAAYLYHIAENQPFIDGNKRTATDTALTFLRVNGGNTSFPEMFPYELCIAIAEKRVDKVGVAQALKTGHLD